MTVGRVLDAHEVADLEGYIGAGGGIGLATARRLRPSEVREEVAASGLRGRGGAGFPTAIKWETVAANQAPNVSATVVVNGAEGEPGSFKDRLLLRRNPFKVLEGALIAARAVGADRVIVAVKRSFAVELARLEDAVQQVTERGWAEGVAIDVVAGPDSYLFGEETAMLEVLAGRPPFPRIAPPYRHGFDELGGGARGAADTVLAATGPLTEAPPTLVNNVESMANVACILAHGPTWFREVGTAASPGTILCTVTGDVRRHGVAEVPLGTPVGEIIEVIGGGVPHAAPLALLSGVSNALLPAELWSVPATYEDLSAAGSGLGSASFIVIDQRTDPLAVAAGVARFLSVESCGQCTPCKTDGLTLSRSLDRLVSSSGSDHEMRQVERRLLTVADGARCSLASQQQTVIESVLRLFPDLVASHVRAAIGAGSYLVAPIVAFDQAAGVAMLDERHARKQPDWTFDAVDSGKTPVDRIGQLVG